MLMVFSIINHPFGGTPISGSPHLCMYTQTGLNGLDTHHIYEWGRPNYLLLMDMAKVGGPLSVVKVFAQI